VDDVLEILSVPLLGIVPESKEVLHSSNKGEPITISSPESAPARAYFEAAGRLTGSIKGAATVAIEKPGLFSKWFTRKAA
jgi:septum site-determining protein MinD